MSDLDTISAKAADVAALALIVLLSMFAAWLRGFNRHHRTSRAEIQRQLNTVIELQERSSERSSTSSLTETTPIDISLTNADLSP